MREKERECATDITAAPLIPNKTGNPPHRLLLSTKILFIYRKIKGNHTRKFKKKEGVCECVGGGGRERVNSKEQRVKLKG